MGHRRFLRRPQRASNYDYWHVWTLPILLGILSTIGLLSALIGDGLWDGISWLCLAIPLAIIGWFALKPRSVKRYR